MWKNLALLFFGIILFVLVLAVTGILPILWRLIYGTPGGDKVAHVVFMGTLAYLVNLITFPRRVKLMRKTILLGTVMVIVFVTVEEFSQLFIPGRNFDLFDLAFSYLGIAISVWLFNYIKKARIKNKDPM